MRFNFCMKVGCFDQFLLLTVLLWKRRVTKIFALHSFVMEKKVFRDMISCEPCYREKSRSNFAIKLRNNLKESHTEKNNNYGFAVNSNLELEAQLESAEKEWKEYQRSYKPLIQLEVTSITIAEVLSSRTGIPVTKLQASQMQQLLQLDIELHKRVIGQDEACNAIARAIQRSRAGLSDPKRPIASLMFMGPTGVRFSS